MDSEVKPPEEQAEAAPAPVESEHEKVLNEARQFMTHMEQRGVRMNLQLKRRDGDGEDQFTFLSSMHLVQCIGALTFALESSKKHLVNQNILDLLVQNAEQNPQLVKRLFVAMGGPVT